MEPRNGSQQSSQTGGGAAAVRQENVRREGKGDAQPQQNQRDLSVRRGSSAPARRSQDPFTSFLRLSNEMDRLFDSLLDQSFGSVFGQSSGRTPALEEINALWSPRIDVRQRGDSLVLHADLPGIKSEDVRIETTGEGLAIYGEMNNEREEEDEGRGYRLSERRRGSFYRLVPLPDEARADNAKASMRNGVLEVTIPLERSKDRRQIKIES